jgi:hypothetical protein
MKTVNMKLLGRVPGINEQLSSTSQYSTSIMVKIENEGLDQLNSYSTVMAVGYSYNVHWHLGIDWQHMLVIPSEMADPTDPPIILRFNNTQNREKYQMFSMIANKLVRNYTTVNIT